MMFKLLYIKLVMQLTAMFDDYLKVQITNIELSKLLINLSQTDNEQWTVRKKYLISLVIVLPQENIQ